MTKDVNYLRSDIEFNRLNRPGELIFAANTAPNGTNPVPRVHTTDNGIAYLSGQLVLTAPLGVNDKLVLFPEGLQVKALQPTLGFAIQDQPPLLDSLMVEIVDNEIRTKVAILAGDIIYFDTLSYLTS